MSLALRRLLVTIFQVVSTLSLFAPVAQAQGVADVPDRAGDRRAWDAARESRELAVRAPVDPASYRLGPLDGVVLAIWDPSGGHTATHTLTITLEQRLLVPLVGVIDVAGLTLAEAGEVVDDALRRRLGDVRTTLTLTDLRRMKIPVTGRVSDPGIHVVRALERVSELLDRVGLAEGASHRAIEIRRDGSPRATADLLRFRTMGDLDANPVLENGDVVHVPFGRRFVFVYGAVNAPGRYELVEGDRVSDLLSYAGGLAPDARADTLALSRVSDAHDPPLRVSLVARVGPGGGTIYAPVSAGKAPATDHPLDSNDRLFVPRIGDWENRQVARVIGEVERPGEIPIVEGVTTLSEAISRSGGLTADASLEEAQLVRTASLRLADKEFERLGKIPVADMSEDEYEYYKMRGRETPGRMVVDFRRALAGDPEQDVTLIDGDEIQIPRRKDYVSVLGLVRDPGNVEFDGALGYRDYVTRAGGFADRADRGSARVVRVGSGEWEKPGDVRAFRPGDTIWIPEKKDRNYWRLFRDGLLVATQIATLYLVADRAID